MNRSSETPENFGCPNGVENSELFSQETYHSQNSDMQPWNLKQLQVHFCRFHLSENEWIWMNIYDWTLMLLKDFREPLLPFELIYSRNSFCYRIENSCGFRYKILGKTLIFCLPWDCWNFRIFWAFCLCWSCPTQNLSTALWIMLLLQILKKLWSFIF